MSIGGNRADLADRFGVRARRRCARRTRRHCSTWDPWQDRTVIVRLDVNPERRAWAVRRSRRSMAGSVTSPADVDDAGPAHRVLAASSSRPCAASNACSPTTTSADGGLIVDACRMAFASRCATGYRTLPAENRDTLRRTVCGGTRCPGASACRGERRIDQSLAAQAWDSVRPWSRSPPPASALCRAPGAKRPCCSTPRERDLHRDLVGHHARHAGAARQPARWQRGICASIGDPTGYSGMRPHLTFDAQEDIAAPYIAAWPAPRRWRYCASRV